MTTSDPKPSILVVDDDRNVQKLLKRLLLKEGYLVIACEDAGTALQTAIETCPDLILLDINMPVVDGYTLCRQILKQPSCEDIPVIFVSGLLEENDKIKGFAAGAVDYLTKPIQNAETLARIRLHLSLKEKMTELKIFNNIMIEREMRIIELKEEVNSLNLELGRTAPYSEIWHK
ncbi:PleD family two-component system response regulator [Desulfopila sp. IMCC35008]|uniref:response regulator n=1 Tax=Desulfopila sp. IMCC35008 TaxID=2653858 RepID=UPI0013D63DD7|nr:response regulator [Desulfopila sp. IMCC35008]